MSQLKVSLPTFGLGENMAKNPLKAPPIQGLLNSFTNKFFFILTLLFFTILYLYIYIADSVKFGN